MRDVDHEERQIDCIGDGSFFDGHEVLHPPELFGVSEVEFSSSRFCLTRWREAAKLKMVPSAFFAAPRETRDLLEFDLDAQAIVVNQGVVCEREISAEQQCVCAGATLQIGLDQDHDIEWVGKALVQHLRLINIRANPLVLTGRHLVTLWNRLNIKFVAIATAGSGFLLFPLVRKVERRIVTQFRDQVQSQMNDRGSTAMNDYLPWEFICKTSGGQPRKQQIFM